MATRPRRRKKFRRTHSPLAAYWQTHRQKKKPSVGCGGGAAEVWRPSGPIEFVDVTAQAGIHFKHNTGAFGKKYLPETMGSGVCFIDYDNDGWQDILFVNSMDWPERQSGTKSFPALYHNNHDGTFTDVTRQAGLAIETYGLGCAVGDYDNDGFEDLYLTTVGSNHLFLHKIEATERSGRLPLGLRLT